MTHVINETRCSLVDLGFRVFKLDTSNIRAWEPDRDDLERTLLTHLDHIKADRSEDDILYELLLKLGTRPLRAHRDAYHRGEAGAFHRCRHVGSLSRRQDRRGRNIEPLAHGIAAWHAELVPAGETTVVFRDSAFTDDVAKTNCTAILHQHGLGNVRSL